MCSVEGVMAAGAIISAIATGVQTGIGIDAEQKKAAAAAKEAERNAGLARSQSADITAKGEWEASKTEAAGRDAESKALAGIAASGVALSGSAENLTVASRFNALADANRIRAAAAKQAWGLGEEATDYLDRAAQARQAGVLGSVSVGISGGSQILQQGMSFASGLE